SEGAGFVNSERTFVSRMVILRTIIREQFSDSRFRDGLAWRNLQLYAPIFGETAANRLDEVFPRLDGLREPDLKNLAGFLLHGAAVLGGADAELALGRFIESADGKASHTVYDSIAVNDSNDGNAISDCKSSQRLEVRLRGGQRFEVRLQWLRSLRLIDRFAPQGSYLRNLTSDL